MHVQSQSFGSTSVGGCEVEGEAETEALEEEEGDGVIEIDTVGVAETDVEAVDVTEAEAEGEVVIEAEALRDADAEGETDDVVETEAEGEIETDCEGDGELVMQIEAETMDPRHIQGLRTINARNNK